LFNNILNIRLDNLKKKNRLIHQSQIGFTKYSRTADHDFILKTLIDKYCQSKNGRLYACFVDFHKAFDSVIHVDLKLKLLKMNVGTMFDRIIANMYEHSRACVKVGGSLTESFVIKLCVRQDDNLSPSLFKFAINDFASYLDSCTDTVLLHSEKLNCLMYKCTAVC
jgi:hypothetical protein